MAEVKWIKLSTDMFDNAKIKYLRTLPEGNNIILIWVMLLAKAGKCNSNGFIFLTENIPYTKEMLASEFGFELNTITLALGALEKLNMIETKEETLLITGWEEHQNVDGLEKIREQNRKRQARFKNKQKALLGKSEGNNVSSNVTDNVEVTQGNATDKEKEIDIEIDIDKELEERKEDTTQPLSFPTPIHELLFNQFGEVSYKTWLSNLKVTDDEIVIYAANKPFEELIKKRYADAIETLTGKKAIVKEVS